MEQHRGWFHLLFLRNLEDSPGRLKRSPRSRGLKKRRWEIAGWQGSTLGQSKDERHRLDSTRQQGWEVLLHFALMRQIQLSHIAQCLAPLPQAIHFEF